MPPLCTKMGPQRRIVGYDLPSIIRYSEPLIHDLITARFVGFHFNKTFFLLLIGDKNVNIHEELRKLLWITPTMSFRSLNT